MLLADVMQSLVTNTKKESALRATGFKCVSRKKGKKKERERKQNTKKEQKKKTGAQFLETRTCRARGEPRASSKALKKKKSSGFCFYHVQ